MQKWEYCQYLYSWVGNKETKSVCEIMNEFAEEGWEVDSVTPTTYYEDVESSNRSYLGCRTYTQYLLIIFKRELP